MSLDDRLIDKRVIERSLKQGRVDGPEYRQALEALPDLSDQIAREDEPSGASRSESNAPQPAAETEAVGL